MKRVKIGGFYPFWAWHGMGNSCTCWYDGKEGPVHFPVECCPPSAWITVHFAWNTHLCGYRRPYPWAGTDPGRVRTQNRRWSLTKIEGIAGCFCRLYPEDQQTKGESLVIVSMGSLMEPPMGISWIEKLCIPAILAAFCNASMSIFFKWNTKGIWNYPNQAMHEMGKK